MIDDEYKGYNDGQIEALQSVGNVLVSASAGSGKTKVMVDKILKILREDENADITRMVVMTFTRAAAAEIKSRLLKKLYEALRKFNQAKEFDKAEHIRKQIEAFPFTNICTIDSFCFNLVKKYFGVIGADPSCTPYGDDEPARILAECINKVCDEKLDPNNPDPDFIAFAERYAYKRKLDSVKELILKLREFWMGQPDGEEFFKRDGEKAVEAYFMNYAKNHLKNTILIGGNALPIISRNLKDFEEKALRMFNNLTALNETIDLEKFFNTFKFFEKEKTKRQSKGLDSGALEAYNDFVKAYNGFIDRIRPYCDAFFVKIGKNYLKKDVETLIDLTISAEKLYAERKKKDNKLDFKDMDKMALSILENEAIRQEIKKSFDYIFVDEYQDTNYVQETLLDGIGNDNVYVVGDVKQAIYQFREAEPEIFKARKELFKNSSLGTAVQLNKSYRSGGKILDFVNKVCSEVMTEETCGINYRDDGVMEPANDFPECDVELYAIPKGLDPKEERVPGIYSVKDATVKVDRDRQAELVADCILKNVGKTLVHRKKDDDGNEPDPTLTYEDIAVIVRTNRQGGKIAAALSVAGIPYNVEKVKEGVDANRELLIDFVRLCYGNDELSVLNVMMSPLFSFTASDLAEIRLQTPKTTLLEAVKSYNGEQNLNLKTQDFLKYVEELRKESAVMKVSELMAKVLADGLEGYFVSLGGDVAIRIKKFVATVQRSDVDGDIEEFLDFCDRYDGEKPPAKKNSVTIITMHRSKGLQYPFVIIPYVSNTTAPPPSKHFDSDVYKNYLFLDRELGIALTDSDEEKGYNSDSFATKVHALKKKLEKINELARLMYVAFTRAESRLVIIGEQVKSGVDFEKIDTIDKFIRYAEGKNPSIADYRKPYVNPDDETDEGIEEDDVATEGENTQEDILDVKYDYLFTPYPYEKATTTSLKTTVSEILEEEEGVKRAFTADSEGKGSAEIGTAYHLVMQKIDFATKSQEDIQAFIDKLATENEIDKVVAEKIEASKIKNLLETKVISEAAVKKLHREMPFLMPYGEEGGLLQGVIDLIIEDEDGLTVVDYKASSADPVTLKNRYEKQIELYSEAAERILKKPVTGRYLLNLMRSYEVRI